MRPLLSIVAILLTLYQTICEKQEVVDSIINKFVSDKASTKELFKVYHHLYNKQSEYNLNSQEALLRYKAFKDNLKYINQRNQEQDNFKLGITQFTDLTNEEYRNTHLMKIAESETIQANFMRFLETKSDYFDFDAYVDEETVTQTRKVHKEGDSYDWTNYLVAAKNQKSCGSCYAFGAGANIEAMYNLWQNNSQNGTQISLSEQSIVDCNSLTGGCGGGFPFRVFKYLTPQSKAGIPCSSQYKYTAKASICLANDTITQNKVYLSGYQACTYDTRYKDYYPGPLCNQTIILNMLANGPYTVVVDAGSREYQNYKSGYLLLNTTQQCTNKNHVNLVVGYGVDPSTGKEFYKVRNSWGQSWGDKGYYKILRSQFTVGNTIVNTCFIENNAVQPNIDTNRTQAFTCPN